MNKIIKEQIEKCKVADLSQFDSSTNTYHIKKFNQIRVEVDDCYLIKLDTTLLNKDTSSVLATNWNKGTYPPCIYFKAVVSKVLGKMIYINGLGYNNETKEDLDIMWNGWLPLQDIELLERI